MLKPAEVFPPGKFIQEELDTRGWTKRYLEQISGLSQAQIDLLIEGNQSITPEIAQKLSVAFDTSSEFWLRLEGAYRARQVATKVGPAGASSTR